MEQQIIAIVNQHIAQRFIEVKNILLHPDSYSQAVETQHLFDYFRFLETALQKPYNRLISLTAFLQDTEGVMSNRMYPLALLNPTAKQAIDEKHRQVANFVNGLDIGGIDPNAKGLCTEEQVEGLLEQ